MSTENHPLPTIMIVDDTPANVGVLGWYFEENGFRVVVAQDGEEAIERARVVLPDLILLDVMMPGIDGFETCRRLKMMEGLRETPVIFMTALADTTEKISGFRAGGVDYVTKPCQIEEVLARVNTHLSLRTMQRQLAQQNRALQEAARARNAGQAELALARATLDAAPDAVFWIAPDGRIVYANDSACRLAQRDRAALEGMHVADLETGSPRDRWADDWVKVRQKQDYDTTAVLSTAGGTVEVRVIMRHLVREGRELAAAWMRPLAVAQR